MTFAAVFLALAIFVASLVLLWWLNRGDKP